MAEDRFHITQTCCMEKESVFLAERIAKFGCLVCDLKTGRYHGSGVAEGLLKITGKSNPTIEDMFPFIHPDDRDKIADEYARQFEGRGRAIEYRVIIEGQVRYMRSAMETVYDENGKAVRAVGFIQEITEQKLEQQARIKSERQYRSLFHDTCYAISLLRPNGSFVECNQKMLEVYRAGDEEQFFEYAFATLAPSRQPSGNSSREEAEKQFQAARKTGHQEFEWLARGLDGKKFWTFVSLTKLDLEDQDLFQIILRDIDQEKKYREKLVESESKYKSLFENSAFATWIFDKDVVFVDCNSLALQIVGLTDKAKLANLKPYDFSPQYQPNGKTSKQCIEEIFETLWEKNRCDFEWLNKTFDGEEFWVHVYLTKITVKGRDYIQAVIRDIDAEKRAKQLLQESEEHKEFIIKNAGLTMWIWNIKTGIAKATDPNSPLTSHFPPKGMLVEEFIENIHKDDREMIRKGINELLASEVTNPELEYRYPNPHGGWTWIKTNAMVVERDPDGMPLVAIGFHQDITEPKKYEQGLLKAKKITEEANQAKSLFLANMSHEIRTPMTAILGYLDLICDSDITPTEREEYAQTMRRNGIHLLELINEILDLSKIESGQIDLHLDYAKTVPLILNVVDPLGGLAKEKGVSLVVDYLTEIPEKIWTDARFLRQILWNIVGNAVKFTDEGRVRVIVEYFPPSKRKMIEEASKPALKISVEDTGCGIPDTRLQTIFEPFVQADSTAARKFGGTGLGLAIARRQIEMMGGTIRAWNNLNGGSTFEVMLPLSKTKGIDFIQPEAALTLTKGKKKEKTKSIVPTTLEGIRVLLAEDGMDNQRLISTVLRKARATVDIANNGLEAIEMVRDAKQQAYDVILMDMQMPLLDGYAATSKLRQMKVDTPIIALTAYAMSGDRKKCLESGCDNYCTKPVRPQQLVTLIAQYIQTRHFDHL